MMKKLSSVLTASIVALCVALPASASDVVTPIVITNDVTHSDSSSLITPQANVAYGITIRTADVADAGTGANVTIRINGTAGSTEFALGNSGFEQNERFYKGFSAIDVGTIQSITLRHDGKGHKPGWYVSTVLVQKGSKTYSFTGHSWIDAEHNNTITIKPNQ
ncbi:PLAT/LH2 domain-containing protein [Paenibacillus sp. SGZ-1009]|uniref:PLAT/LH2 domain-containing protein n=1 Tax=Paenibacillus campi TaxID=3106031 RepID=UPI002B0009F0|nr:PLAT/LH2 domain-containing protein [Paenibacillus sp. SGZ-1009]